MAEDASVQLELERGQVREVGGEPRIEWSYRLLRSATPPLTVRGESRCAPTGVEVPWRGLPQRFAGAPPITVSALLPFVLDVGVPLAGTTRYESAGGRALTTEREGVVTAHEPLETAIGTLDCVRIETVARTRYGDAVVDRHETEWLARGVGLVRARESTEGRITLDLELEAWTPGG